MDRRTELYGQLAGDMNALIDQRSAEFDAPSDEWLNDPEQSFFTFVAQSANEIVLNKWSEDQQKFLTQKVVTAEDDLQAVHIAVHVSSRSAELALKYDSPTADDETLSVKMWTRVISKVQKDNLATDVSDSAAHMQGLSILGYIAAATKPVSSVPDVLPTKKPDETAEEKIFRAATTALSQYVGKRPTASQQHGLELLAHNGSRVTSLAQIDRSVVGPIEQAVAGQAFRHHASEILSHVLSPNASAEQLDREMQAWGTRADAYHATLENSSSETPLDEILGEAATNPTIIYIETGKELLQSDVGSRQDRPLAERQRQILDSEGIKRTVDPSRLVWLGRLASEWTGSNEITLALIDLKNVGNYDYYAAILPETLPNGTVIYHAVAENQAEGNALFVFRGEKGYDADSDDVWLNWKDVFVGNTRKGAQHLGARRMLHTPTLHNRVLDELTRHPDTLSR